MTPWQVLARDGTAVIVNQWVRTPVVHRHAGHLDPPRFGKTVCGLDTTPHSVLLVRAAHAVRIGRPCRRCFP